MIGENKQFLRDVFSSYEISNYSSKQYLALISIKINFNGLQFFWSLAFVLTLLRG